ncbi:MAG: hypothetical protein AAGH41_08950 [Pseudomonadota bacterium]
MKRLVTAAVSAVLMFGGAGHANTIAGGVTSVEVTADLGSIGLAGSPIGGAGVSVNANGNAVFAFDITGGFLNDDFSSEITHSGGVRLEAVADSSVFVELSNFTIDTVGTEIRGDVVGTGVSLISQAPIFTFSLPALSPSSDPFGAIDDLSIELLISTAAGGVLTDIFDAPSLAGATFGFAVTDPSPVPLPAAGLLMAGGLAAFASKRRAA